MIKIVFVTAVDYEPRADVSSYNYIDMLKSIKFEFQDKTWIVPLSNIAAIIEMK